MKNLIFPRRQRQRRHFGKSQVIHVINAFFIKEAYNDFQTLFWIPEFPSNPFYRFFYFFNKIKLSITMTKRLSSIKEGLQSYCNKVYPRSSFNTMWRMKYSYDLLDNFNSRFNSREVHLSKK